MFTACSIEEQIHRIIKEDKWQACALVLCILFGSKFDINWLKPESTSEDKKTKIRNILIECDVLFPEETALLKSAFTALKDNVLTQNITVFVIFDFNLYKQVAVICGNYYTECFIRHAYSRLIRDLFLFESAKELIKENADHIMISREKEGQYFDRLLKDLIDSNINSTFQNKQLKYSSFVNKLTQFFEGNEKAKKILKNLDNIRRPVKENDRNNTSTTTPLIEAASGGYFEIVYFLIDSVKSEVNNPDVEGRTALYKASKEGNTAVVKLLLEKNADANKCNMCKESPLYMACKKKPFQYS